MVINVSLHKQHQQERYEKLFALTTLALRCGKRALISITAITVGHMSWSMACVFRHPVKTYSKQVGMADISYSTQDGQRFIPYLKGTSLENLFPYPVRENSLFALVISNGFRMKRTAICRFFPFLDIAVWIELFSVLMTVTDPAPLDILYRLAKSEVKGS